MRAPWYPVEDRRGGDEAEVQRRPHSRECDEAREDDEDRAHVDTSDATPSRDATSGATSGRDPLDCRRAFREDGRDPHRGVSVPERRASRTRQPGERALSAGPDPFGVEPDELVRAVGRW